MGTPKSTDSVPDDFGKDKPSIIEPSEFMRGRHPDLFSDSVAETTLQLPQPVFEYYLVTLTNRKQETEFEYFARRLAEKELCPNLIPQTGPTGGGDSKVDTETYPVADELTLRWYVGVGAKASQERWAFAFSAKKDWRGKIKSDVEKIISTDRDYKLIYFISNQFIKDKSRAAIEDELTKQYGISVRVLDRTWIVKCIFEHNHQELAIEALNIKGYRDVASKTVGPNDSRRQQQLTQLEQQIADTSRYRGVTYQLAEDCLQAALLARGLELPRTEVDGRFDRAERIAQVVNHKQQQLRIFYNRAWTVYWWYNDYQTFRALYDQVEQLAENSDQADDLELLSNLWNLLYVTVHREALDRTSVKFPEKTKKLKSELQRLASDNLRPNNSMNAKSSLLMVELMETRASGGDLKPLFASLKELLLKSKGFPGFSAQPVMEEIRELGDFITDDSDYDDLFETVVTITEQRSSQGDAGLALYERGIQKYKAKKPYDAIRYLGRAQQKLALDEYRHEWISSLALCGLAYESTGLLWAARANILSAINYAFKEYTRSGKFPPPTIRLIQKLLWLELQLGRIPYILATRDVADIISNIMSLDSTRKSAYEDEQDNQDMVLCMLCLKSKIEDLQRIEFLPIALESQGFYKTRTALLYALGYEDYLRTEGTITPDISPEEVYSLYKKLLDQPANADIAQNPDYFLDDVVKLHSVILGCQVTIETANNDTSLMLAEIVIGALEALLATCLDIPIMPYREEMIIEVSPLAGYKGQPNLVIDDETDEPVKIFHDIDFFKDQSIEERTAFHDWLAEFVIEVSSRIIALGDPDTFLDTVIGDEQGLLRAVVFADTQIAITNIYGSSPKIHMSDWNQGGEIEKFPCKREEALDFSTQGSEEPKEKEPIKFGTGEPPEELTEVEGVKHKDHRVLSLINIPVWNKAEWRAIFYLQLPQTLPIMGLGFMNLSAARNIFIGLKKRLGDIDKDEQLRITVITGIDSSHPSYYRVVISTDLESRGFDPKNRYVVVSRIQTMQPPDSTNLDNFLNSYRLMGKYVVLPACFTSEEALPEPQWDLGIVKAKLIVRNAWEIGKYDPDMAGILEGDDPIIPQDVKDAPVLQALQRFEHFRKRKRHKVIKEKK